MTARLRNVLHWLGTIIAVLAIGGAIIWNGLVFLTHQEAREALDILRAEKPDQYILETVTRVVETMLDDGTPRADIDAYIAKAGYNVAEVRHANEWKRRYNALVFHVDDLEDKQESSLILGGVAVLFGLVAYGVGWMARYVLRGPS